MTAIATHIQAGQTHSTERRAEPASVTGPQNPTKRAIWTSRVLAGLATLFLSFDAAIKVLGLPIAVEGTAQLGYPTSVIFGIGVTEIVCLAAYLVPRTAVLGAILWTGYLGGAIATHVRVGNPLFSHVLFPIYVAAFIWDSLWLREPRLRALLPLAKGRR